MDGQSKKTRWCQNQKMKRYIITKRIAKHGSQAIIVIPRVLENQLKPKTLVQLTIDVVDDDSD